jgi:hypothetical protein
MKMLRTLMACLALAATHAAAIIPENGWWWASNEAGRGFNIEVQNNLLFFAAFAYDSGGAPTWITAGGAMSSDRDFTGPLTRYTSGQCFGCAYVAPTPVAAGTLTLRFTSSQTAVLTINGASISVKRFDFWENDVAPNAMMGEWSSVIGASGDVFDADRITYNTRTTDSSGGPILGGSRLGSTASSNPAVVLYSPATGRWTALLDSSTSFYRLFDFGQTGFNRVEGNFWIYAKGGSPSGSGTFFQAFRTASAAFVQSGAGPASTKRLDVDLPFSQVLDARDDALFITLEAQGKLLGRVEPDLADRARALERELAILRQRQ